ncbi:transcription elongation protein SprT [Burkholderia pyrrocinia]
MASPAQSETVKLNRETWLNSMAALMAPRFAELGKPLPKFRVTIGWTSGGKNDNATGECWSPRVSEDEHFEIFLTPRRSDSMAVACTLAHELTHAAVGLAEGHKGEFARVARALGFTGRLTHAQQPPALQAWIQPMIDKLGALPHAAIMPDRPRALIDLSALLGDTKRKPVEDGDDDGDDEGTGKDEPLNNKPPRQSTRMHKTECTECGYTARVSAKWLKVGAPLCPAGHGPMDYDVDAVEGTRG